MTRRIGRRAGIKELNRAVGRRRPRDGYVAPVEREALGRELGVVEAAVGLVRVVVVAVVRGRCVRGPERDTEPEVVEDGVCDVDVLKTDFAEGVL